MKETVFGNDMKKGVDGWNGFPSLLLTPINYGRHHHHHHHTMTTTTTEQTEPPALIIAVLNEGKYIIENLSIAGTSIDMYHLDYVLSGLYDPNDPNPSESVHIHSENELLMRFGKCALSDMTKYFVLHSIYLSLATYTRKSVIGKYFNNHIKKETGMDISLCKDNSVTKVTYPKKRELFQCFGILAHIENNHFNVYGDDYQPNDAVKFRIWLRSELNVIAKDLKLIEPGLKALPEVLRLRIKEREERVNRKIAFVASIEKKIPYIGNMAGNLYIYL